MTRHIWPVYFAVAGFMTVGLGLGTFWMQGPLQARPPVTASVPAIPLPPAEAPKNAGAGDAVPLSPQPQVAAVLPIPADPQEGYYKQLRSRMRWVQTRVDGQQLLTPDLDSRLLLAKSAARRAGLGSQGLSFTDVYGIINAETSWVPRLGASKDGTPNLGIAQFEPATARALGMRNPDDAVEAVHVAALHMKEAAVWSADRISGLKLGSDERAAKLREGVSIYYNLSSRGRNTWNGRNTRKLPRETQRHIQNARIGAQQAEFLNAQLQAMKSNRSTVPAVVTASLQGRD